MLSLRLLAAFANFSGTALPVSNIRAKPDSGRDSIHHTNGYPGVKRHARNGAEDAYDPGLGPVIVSNHKT